VSPFRRPRVFLSAVLQKYIAAEADRGISIADVNQEMDEAARTVSYNLIMTGTKRSVEPQ
jgi:hypothetical protein